MAEFRLTPAAERDLEQIWRYTQREWDSDQADRYTEQLLSACSQLAQAPYIATACDPIRAGYRRQIVSRHNIYFHLADYGIAVVRILHAQMDAPRHL